MKNKAAQSLAKLSWKHSSKGRNQSGTGGRPRIYSPCPRYKNRVHRFSVHVDGKDRCPCGYERNTKMNFKDYLVDTPNPRVLDATLQQMGAVLIGGPDNFLQVNSHYVMRALSNPDYVRFACEHQGYCKVIGECESTRDILPK